MRMNSLRVSVKATLSKPSNVSYTNPGRVFNLDLGACKRCPAFQRVLSSEVLDTDILLTLKERGLPLHSGRVESLLLSGGSWLVDRCFLPSLSLLVINLRANGLFKSL